MKRMLVALVALCAAAGIGMAAEVQQPILGDVAGVSVQDDVALDAVRGDGLIGNIVDRLTVTRGRINLVVYWRAMGYQIGDGMEWIQDVMEDAEYPGLVLLGVAAKTSFIYNFGLPR